MHSHVRPHPCKSARLFILQTSDLDCYAQDHSSESYIFHPLHSARQRVGFRDGHQRVYADRRASDWCTRARLRSHDAWRGRRTCQVMACHTSWPWQCSCLPRRCNPSRCQRVRNTRTTACLQASCRQSSTICSWRAPCSPAMSCLATHATARSAPTPTTPHDRP